MKIFEKRPLSLILCTVLAGFSFFALAEMSIKIFLIICASLIFILSYLPSVFIRSKRIIIRILSTAFAISILLTILWNQIFFPIFSKDRVAIKGELTDFNGNSSIIVSSKNINGKDAKHKLLVYVGYDIIKDVKVGDTVIFNATVEEIESTTDFDSRSYYFSRGISAICKDVDDITITEKADGEDVEPIALLRELITSTLRLRTNDETGGFLSALLIGNRAGIDGNTKLNFGRIGISHILALSGMHVSMMAFAVSKVLSIFKLNKKIKLFTTSLFTVFYMALAGFSPSVTRAGIMLLICNLLFLICKSNDSITTLSISVFLIVIVTPHSVFDLSLWLSAFATLGILCFSELWEKKRARSGLMHRIINFMVSSIGSSVFAIGATFIFCVLKFDTTSVIAVVSTMIFSFITEIFIYGGIIALIFGGIIPMSAPLIFLSDSIKMLAEIMSRPSWVSASTEFTEVKLLTVLFSLCFFAFLILNIKRKLPAVLALFIMFSSIFVTAEAMTLLRRYNDDILYSTEHTHDALLLKSSGNVTVVQTESPTSSSVYYTLDLLDDEHITHVNSLLLCGYSSHLTDNLLIMLNNIKIDTVRLPEPLTDEELVIAKNLSSALSLYGATMRFYKNEEALDCGDYTYFLLERSLYRENSDCEYIFTLLQDGDYTTYFSSGAHINAGFKALTVADNSKTVILGSSGGSRASFDLVLEKTERLIIGNKNALSDYAEDYYDDRKAIIDGSKELVSIKNKE